MERILFIILGTITLGAALAVVTQRTLSCAAWLLALSCLGIAGLLFLLEAPAVAALQLLVGAGGVALLARKNEARLRQTAPPGSAGVTPRWWAGALVAAALAEVLLWTAFHYDPGMVPVPTAQVSLAGYALPMATAVVLLATALVGALEVARKR